MKRFLLAVGTTLVLSSGALAQKASLPQLSAYLNGLKTAKGSFTQINSDGTLATGTLYIRRPGRVRFEYNPPEKSLVMASNGSVAIFDPKGDAESYPLSQTPLSIILADKVNLSRARMVTGHRSDGKTTTIVAQDPDNPDYGSIELVFTANPIELRQWVITDNGGSTTTVILGELEKGRAIPNRLFNIFAEKRRRGE